ncbi:hypothetical protein D9611_010558 [Ephemerocybe angulata]|uniref:Uncharacterized protein n=1 Tax=Ephemerocybe angulata TaxID=980116 RepID=A0A8H5BV94_9AGAR|nr:hypothetical protein D9611_010558 [Tulosesus angulatus]
MHLEDVGICLSTAATPVLGPGAGDDNPRKSEQARTRNERRDERTCHPTSWLLTIQAVVVTSPLAEEETSQEALKTMDVEMQRKLPSSKMERKSIVMQPIRRESGRHYALLVCLDTDEGRNEARAQESGKERGGDGALGEGVLLAVKRVKVWALQPVCAHRNRVHQKEPPWSLKTALTLPFQPQLPLLLFAFLACILFASSAAALHKILQLGAVQLSLLYSENEADPKKTAVVIEGDAIEITTAVQDDIVISDLNHDILTPTGPSQNILCDPRARSQETETYRTLTLAAYHPPKPPTSLTVDVPTRVAGLNTSYKKLSAHRHSDSA